jgi:hypothetical protein
MLKIKEAPAIMDGKIECEEHGMIVPSPAGYRPFRRVITWVGVATTSFLRSLRVRV